MTERDRAIVKYVASNPGSRESISVWISQTFSIPLLHSLGTINKLIENGQLIEDHGIVKTSHMHLMFQLDEAELAKAKLCYENEKKEVK